MDSEKIFPFKDQETEIIETDLVIRLEILGIRTFYNQTEHCITYIFEYSNIGQRI